MSVKNLIHQLLCPVASSSSGSKEEMCLASCFPCVLLVVICALYCELNVWCCTLKRWHSLVSFVQYWQFRGSICDSFFILYLDIYFEMQSQLRTSKCKECDVVWSLLMVGVNGAYVKVCVCVKGSCEYYINVYTSAKINHTCGTVPWISNGSTVSSSARLMFFRFRFTHLNDLLLVWWLSCLF